MSKPGFILGSSARADLLEIWTYISADSENRADRVIARLLDAFARVAENPGIGHLRENLWQSRLRFWTVSPYIVAYLKDTAPVEIIGVIHGARLLESLLRQRMEGPSSSEDE